MQQQRKNMSRTIRLGEDSKTKLMMTHVMAGADIVSLLRMMVAFSITASYSPLVANYSSEGWIRGCLAIIDRVFSSSKGPSIK